MFGRVLNFFMSKQEILEAETGSTGIQEAIQKYNDSSNVDKNPKNPNENEEDKKMESVTTLSKGEDDEDTNEDEEEGECGFCVFMKGGGCKDSFTAWEKCVEDAEKNKEDIVGRCFEVTRLLKKCMDEHASYYEPIMRAEKAMEEEAQIELDEQSKSGGKLIRVEVNKCQEASTDPCLVTEKKEN